MKLLWGADLHLNHATETSFLKFVAQVRKAAPDALVVTGDTAEGNNIARFLQVLINEVRLPIAYVLGNHDFYRASIAVVREEVGELPKPLIYLPDLEEPYEVEPDVGLIGVDGWGDGRVGAFTSEFVQLADWVLIKDFTKVMARLFPENKLKLLRELGDQEADKLRASLPRALAKYKKVIVATHVPPFWEAAWHDGEKSDKFWAPWFVWEAGGKVLFDAAKAHPENAITVLCSHTHGSGIYRPMPNLEVRTSSAWYGHPEKSVQGVVVV